jgi:hypothetical protein
MDALADAWPQLWSDGRVHDRHVLVGVEGYRGHGPSGTIGRRPPPATGRILAEVVCTDPGREREWDRWYDEQHLPDMMGSAAFARGSRWRRVRPPAFAPRFATLYDVEGLAVAEAVARSAAIMPGLVAAGRKPAWHTGGRTLVLVP